MTQQCEKLGREKKNLEIQLDAEKSKLEVESKKLAKLLSDLAMERQQSNQEKQANEKQQLNDSVEKRKMSGLEMSPTTMVDHRRTSGSGSVEYANLSGNNNINVWEGLQSKLKQKDGEITQLQVNT